MNIATRLRSVEEIKQENNTAIYPLTYVNALILFSKASELS